MFRQLYPSTYILWQKYFIALENIRLSELAIPLLISSGYLMINCKQVALLILLTCLLLATVLFHTQSEGTNELGTKEGRQFNFVAAGDFGCSAEANRTVTDMVKECNDFMLIQRVKRN
mgnify:CR=1 FL=1